MNYLQLCQRLIREAGVAGGGPSAVTGQAGKLLKVVDWVQQAWIDIQLMRENWNFMWKEFSFDSIVDRRDYPPADAPLSLTDLGRWDTGSFVSYLKSSGAADEGWLEYRPYAKWREEFRPGYTARDSGQIQHFTILPNRTIRLEPAPNAVFTVSGEYMRSVQTFAADADVPTGLPDDFHLIIVWQALKYYASFENAPEVMDEAETHFDDLLHRLENDQLPEMSEAYETLA